jgi:hypothetical protein
MRTLVSWDHQRESNSTGTALTGDSLSPIMTVHMVTDHVSEIKNTIREAGPQKMAIPVGRRSRSIAAMSGDRYAVLYLRDESFRTYR